MGLNFMKRKGISKSLRFEIFKRDKFQCKYCGRKTPDVVLHVDHIQPVSSGGTNDLLNLISACEECNIGKGKRLLSDDTIAEKTFKYTKDKIKDLIDRKEQVEFMIKARKSLDFLEEKEIKNIEEYWQSRGGDGVKFTAIGRQDIKKLMNRFSLDEILEAISIAATTYFEYENGIVTIESASYAFSKIGGVCYNKKHKLSP